MKKLLVTSALPYANGPIHLGHLVEAVQTDVIVRWQRLAGRDAIYVCADDTHGTPIELKAREQGVTPEALIARVGEGHRRDFADFEINFARYGSTHTPENRAVAVEIFERLRARGDIDRRPIELSYCEKDRRFLPDRFVRGTCPRCGAADQYGDVCESCKSTYRPEELKDARCALCGTPPVRRTSTHYFFKLSRHLPLLSGIAGGQAEPRVDVQVQRFLQGWIDKGLDDWCVSRDGPYFGFPIPGEEDKFFYVWLDAPIGYISNSPERDAYWRKEADAEIWHVIGKDIIYFHALFWPAMLEGADYKLPSRILVHGMLNVRGEKMSKSRGRLTTAREYLSVPGLHPEHLRYYFAANLPPEPVDIDLNAADFRHRVNAELVNNVANFAHRTLSLLRDRFGGRIAAAEPGPAWTEAVEALRAAVPAYEALDLKSAVAAIVAGCAVGNGFLQANKPWAAEPGKAHADLSLCVNLAYAAALLLSPVTPGMSAEVLRQVGREGATLADLGLGGGGLPAPWIREGKVGEGRALMPRIETKAAQALVPGEGAVKEASNATARGSLAPAVSPGVGRGEGAAGLPEIPFETFAALDLRCGVILAAETVAGAKKLLKLTVDLGEGSPRVIASGIAESFRPEQLVERHVVVVANLAPRTLRGIASRGMLLAAGDGAAVSLVELPRGVPAGAKVR